MTALLRWLAVRPYVAFLDAIDDLRDAALCSLLTFARRYL